MPLSERSDKISSDVAMETLICDGCGFPADDEHLRRRIERLELATRFRPIHIGVLLLADAPPAAREDYFYLPSSDRAARSSAGRAFFDDVMEACGVPGAVEKSEETCLGELQRAGFFLAYVAECPLGSGARSSEEEKRALDEEELGRRSEVTLVKRIRHSYKPKRIVLLGGRTRPLIPVLQGAGFADRLILDRGAPLTIPEANEQPARARFCEALARIVRGVAAQSRDAL